MKKFNATLAAAVLLLSGTAFAGAVQPASGEAPFFNAAVAVSASNVQRQDVRAVAARHLPASGEMNAQATPAPASAVARAEVREATRQAMVRGYRVVSGEAA